MQAQRHIRVFGGVLRGPVHRHLVEGQLLGALARDFLVRDRAHAEITQRRRVQAVVCGDAVPDVGLEHRVEAHAGEVDAVVGENVRVVLEMVTELGALGILKNRLERSEHAITIELLRRARVVVVQGHVGGHARLDAERHPDNLGAHIVKAGRLRIERKQPGRPQRLQPALQIPPLGDCLVLGLNFREGRCRGERRRCRTRSGRNIRHGIAPRVARVRSVAGLGRRRYVCAVELS